MSGSSSRQGQDFHYLLLLSGFHATLLFRTGRQVALMSGGISGSSSKQVQDFTAYRLCLLLLSRFHATLLFRNVRWVELMSGGMSGSSSKQVQDFTANCLCLLLLLSGLPPTSKKRKPDGHIITYADIFISLFTGFPPWGAFYYAHSFFVATSANPF